jgi:hypothetical protein
MNLKQKLQRLAGLGAVTGLVIAATAAFADEPATGIQTPATAVSTVFGNAAPISDEKLGTESAKAQIQLDKVVVNEQDMDGRVDHNVASDNQTGNNSVSGEAFGEAAGFVTVIQNTGNNVLIQNSTIVNVAVEP